MACVTEKLQFCFVAEQSALSHCYILKAYTYQGIMGFNGKSGTSEDNSKNSPNLRKLGKQLVIQGNEGNSCC